MKKVAKTMTCIVVAGLLAIFAAIAIIPVTSVVDRLPHYYRSYAAVSGEQRKKVVQGRKSGKARPTARPPPEEVY